MSTTPEDHGLFLPRGYVENHPEQVATSGGDDYWSDRAEMERRRQRRYQDAVYRHAARTRLPPGSVVLDVGCGTGENLVRHFGSRPVRAIGADQPSAISEASTRFPGCEWIAADLATEAVWHDLEALRPALTICADVIEHVADPVLLLQRLRRLIEPTGRLVLSTPDRSRVEDQPPLGPPRNPHHVREWTQPEMRRLLEASGFAIRASRHVLPRRFRPTVLDAKIVAWRALHGRAIPSRRSCMVFELAAA